jgi:prevent-host-death family protein
VHLYKQPYNQHVTIIDLVQNLAKIKSMEVNIHEAKTHLSRLLERVAVGEEVIIAKAGKPVAKLVPIKSAIKKRKLGSAKGKFVVPDDFNDPLPKEIEDLFWK